MSPIFAMLRQRRRGLARLARRSPLRPAQRRRRRSCPVPRHALTEDALRPEDEHEHQHREGDDVLELVRRPGRRARPGRASARPTRSRPGRGRRAWRPGMLPIPPRTAAVNALMPGMKPIEERDLVEHQAVQHAGRAGHARRRCANVVTIARLTSMPIRAAVLLVLGHGADGGAHLASASRRGTARPSSPAPRR